MKTQKTISTRRLVMAALMAALTAAGSALRIKVPVDLVGTSAFHLGNIMCALSGLLLGPGLGGLAAGLGSAIYDMFDPMYISEAWLTFLMKGAYGLAAGLVAHAGKKTWGYWKAVLASASGAVLYALLYLGKNYLTAVFVQGVALDAAFIAVGAKLPATIFNTAVAIVFAPILAVAIRQALKQNHLSLE